MAPRFEDLRRMSLDELTTLYDQMRDNVQLGLGFVREEVAIRSAERQTEAIVRLTWLIALLTAVNTAFVICSALRS